MKNNFISSCLLSASLLVGTNAFSQDSREKVFSILNDSFIEELHKLPYAKIEEIEEDSAPENTLYFGKKISDTEIQFLGNGCLQSNNALTANHVASPSDWKPEILYQDQKTDIFIGKTDFFENVKISETHGNTLNNKEIEFTGLRQDKKWFRITGITQHVFIPKVTMMDLSTNSQVNISGEFYLMKKQADFNSHTLSGSCVTHNDKIIGVLTGFVSIGGENFFLISKITPDLVIK